MDRLATTTADEGTCLSDCLETDSAREGGLGFCLRQRDDAGRWRFIQCGSRFLSETESRYATIELEMLGIAWSCKKCTQYLIGLQQFEVITDHRPLVPIINIPFKAPR